MKTYLKNIKMRRMEMGLSQQKVAAELNCDYSTYGKLENGHTLMDVDRLLKIAEILDTKASVLLGESDPNEKHPKVQVSVQFNMTPEDFKKAGLDKRIKF